MATTEEQDNAAESLARLKTELAILERNAEVKSQLWSFVSGAIPAFVFAIVWIINSVPKYYILIGISSLLGVVSVLYFAHAIKLTIRTKAMPHQKIIRNVLMDCEGKIHEQVVEMGYVPPPPPSLMGYHAGPAPKTPEPKNKPSQRPLIMAYRNPPPTTPKPTTPVFEKDNSVRCSECGMNLFDDNSYHCEKCNKNVHLKCASNTLKWKGLCDACNAT